MADERRYTGQYEKEKSGWGKFLGFLVLFVLVFAAGVWVGANYYPKIREIAGRTAKAPIRGAKNLLSRADTFASKEELLGAIDSSEALQPNDKKRLREQVEKAYKVREEYDGRYKAGVEQLWADAGKLYEEARKDGKLTGSELRSVVAKLNEATSAAQ